MALPLDGLRVLDLSRLLPGPFCTLYLADMGAEVIKVEDPVQGDYIRWLPPYIDKRSARYLSLNRNKKSVALNLKDPRGVEIFLEMVKKSDVVVDSFRPGVLDRLGAGYEAAKKINPRIIYCAITGYGQDGPYSDWAGHDLNYVGYSGVLAMNAPRGEKPVTPGTQIGDLSGAMNAVIGILAALMERGRSGEGQAVDVSLMEGAFFMLPMTFARIQAGDPPPRPGATNLTGGQPCYNTYETSDGKHIALGAIEPKFFKKFCALVGRPELEILHFATGKDGDKLEAELTALFKTKTSAEWRELLEKQDVCFSPVNYPEDAMNDPQIVARGMMTEVPIFEGRTMMQPSLPLKMSRSKRAGGHDAPPDLGEHTEHYLSEIGVEPDEITSLRGRGVIK